MTLSNTGMTRRSFAGAALAAVSLAALGVQGALAQAPADLAALAKAAQGEGEVTFYSAATENVASRVAKEFAAKYDVKAQFLRLSSSQVLQRYATEAESGKIVADLIITGGGVVPFATQGVAKGWVEPISAAGLPALASEYPKAFNRDVSAIVQVQLWQIAYNTERLKAGDAPKDWADLVDPRFKDEFILPDPGSSDAYLELWTLVRKKLGDGFFDKLRALNARRFASGVPAMQSLAAGEGLVQAPVTGPQTKSLQDKGAPLAIVRPSFTTGVEMHLVLTNRAKAKSPNAARLLANWLLTEEGNKILNSEPGNVSVYDKAGFPADYESPDPQAAGRRAEILKLLGF